jgi:signal transduction histidine kinase
MGRLGDMIAAAIVLLGGGLLGGALFPGPELLGPPEGPPILGPGASDAGGPPDPSPASPLATLALLIVPAALMLVRRRWPIPVLAVTFAGFVLAVLFGLPSLGTGIAATIAAHAFAFRARRTVVLVMTAAATALVVVLAFAAAGWESPDPRVFQAGAAMAIAAALGDSARSRQELLLQAEDRARRAEQTREAEALRRVSEERLRIARDLHDTVAHQISVINLQAGAASGHLDRQPERARAALATIREAARGALGEIGDLLRYLRDGESAGSAPERQGIDGLDALLDRMRDAGVEIEADIRGELSRVTGTTGHVAYRVIQEGLTNAHKHGTGHVARLRITVGATRLRIEIDNPVPDQSVRHRSDAVGGGTGLGLIGLRERVAAAKGTASTGRQGGHHRLDVELPLQREGGST